MSAGSTLLLLQQRFSPGRLLRDGFLCDPHLPGGALDIDGNDAGYLVPVAAYGDFTGNARGPAQATGLNRGVCLRHSGENYLHCVGSATNYASTPNHAALAITGPIDVRLRISMVNWSNPTIAAAIGNLSSAASGGVDFGIRSGRLRFSRSYSGEALSIESSIPVEFSSNQVRWIRVVFVPNNGSGNRTTTFFTSEDGETWVQLGTQILGSITGIDPPTTELRIGASPFNGGAAPFRGRIFRVIIRNGIDGPVAFDTGTEWGDHGATSFTAPTGQTVTINATGNNPAGVIGRTVVRGDGVNTFYDFPANALGLFRNVGYGLLGAVARRFDAGVFPQVLITYGRNSGSNRMLVDQAATPNVYRVAGRRLDSDSFQFITASTSHSFVTKAILAEYDWANSDLRQFQNGAKVAETLSFQSAGMTSNLDSQAARVFASSDATASNFYSGDIGPFWGSANPAVSPKLAQLSRHYCRAYNIPYLGP